MTTEHKPHMPPHVALNEITEALRVAKLHDLSQVDIGLQAARDLFEQFEALRETIRHADHFIRQPIDLNYVAIPKDDWEIILDKVSNPASRQDA